VTSGAGPPPDRLAAIAQRAMTNRELIERASGVVFPHRDRDRLFGDVGSALLTDRGNVYHGVCIDTASGTGFCAEASAIAAMVTAREYRIVKIVAVWKDESGGIYVLPPCGRCRLFIEQMDPGNIDTEVILGNTSVPLRDLLPHTDWPPPLDVSAMPPTDLG
jgi:cytidine deaminase